MAVRLLWGLSRRTGARTPGRTCWPAASAILVIAEPCTGRTVPCPPLACVRGYPINNRVREATRSRSSAVLIGLTVSACPSVTVPATSTANPTAGVLFGLGLAALAGVCGGSETTTECMAAGDGAKRLKVCRRLAHPDNQHSAKYWCGEFGLSYATFACGKWYQKYQTDGTPAVDRDRQRNRKRKMTPRTEALIIKSATQDRLSGKAIMRVLTEEYTARGTPQRESPCRTAITKYLHHEALGRVLKPPGRIMVKTPWDARYRVQFANEHKDDDSTKFFYSDEKIFALYDIRGGDAGKTTYSFPGDKEKRNVAKGKTDQQYKDWLKNNQGLKFPKEKAKGRHKVIVWGAVGHNVKSELFVFDQGQNLTNDLYLEILESHVKPLRHTPPGRAANARRLRRPVDIQFIQDNDGKHNSAQAHAWLFNNGINRVRSEQCSVTGVPNERRQNEKGPRANQPRFASFPAYSPDLNCPIEKVWKEMHYRIWTRAKRGEINSREEHLEAILDEWDKIEFEPAVRDGRNWIGINGYVAKWGQVCREVVAEDGFDTKYM